MQILKMEIHQEAQAQEAAAWLSWPGLACVSISQLPVSLI